MLDTFGRIANRLADYTIGTVIVLVHVTADNMVNQAWRQFGRDNDAPSSRTDVGVNYLKVCRRAALLRAW